RRGVVGDDLRRGAVPRAHAAPRAAAVALRGAGAPQEQTLMAKARVPKTGANDASSAAAPSEFPFELPRVTPAQKRRALEIAGALAQAYPHAHCELDYSNPHELLVATILSAQATDAGVNKATPALFKRFPTPADYAASSPAEIEPYI